MIVEFAYVQQLKGTKPEVSVQQYFYRDAVQVGAVETEFRI